MSLVDDVGGVGGFCEFLETINGDDPEEKKSYKIWARSLGWTGRMPKPENMLQLSGFLYIALCYILGADGLKNSGMVMQCDGVPDELKKLRTEEGLTQDQLTLLV